MQNDIEIVVTFLLFYAHCSNKRKEREAFEKTLMIFVAIREHLGLILMKMFPNDLRIS